jgi:hypothetical protein
LRGTVIPVGGVGMGVQIDHYLTINH